MSGWIKIHRQIQDCWIWQNHEYAYAWIDLLLLANHADKKICLNNKPVTIQRGQYHTSINKLAERWKWDKRRVARFLDSIESDGMLTQERSINGTTLTIENYDIFQEVCTTDGTTDGTAKGTTDGTTDGTQTRNKEIKNKRIKEVKSVYGEYKHVKLTDAEYIKLGVDFGETKRALLIKRLDEYIQDNPKYNKDCNLAIRRWVVKAIEEDKPKGRTPNTTFHNFDCKHDYNYDEMEKILLNN